MFKGVFTALISPFDKRNVLDVSAFKGLLEWQAENGVSGFVPCGTTGENPTLSRDEWRTLVETSVQVARPRNLKVIAGCGSNSTEEVHHLIAEAYELGADGALVVTPYYNKPNQRGLIAHYEAIAEKSPLPIVLYNVPGRTGVSLNIETIKLLLENPKIVGIKEASGNQSLWVQLSSEIDLTQKALLAGDDDAFATILSMGGAGIISASANVVPNLFVELYVASVAGDWAKMFSLQKKLLPIVRSMFIETNPSPAKFGLSLLKKCENQLRLPLVSVTPQSETLIRNSMTELGLL